MLIIEQKEILIRCCFFAFNSCLVIDSNFPIFALQIEAQEKQRHSGPVSVFS